MSHQLQSGDDTGEKPSKRPRTSTSSRLGTGRGATACERCRTRKTKCDNLRPKCGQCTKLAVECVYPDEAIANPCLEIGERVLKVVNELSAIVKNQQHHRCSACLSQTATNHISPTRSLPSVLPWSNEDFPTIDPTDSATIANEVASESLKLADQACLEAQGTESVLSWSIFAQLSIPTHLSVGREDTVVLSNSMPSTDRDRLARLADKYIHGVHIMNPILDLSEMNEMIHHEAENGPDWTTRTCLVALVCAIGAVTEPYRERHLSTTDSVTFASPQSVFKYEDSRQLSMEYWSLAVKRLGLAVGQNTVQAVQCLCLAGIFCMHHLRPLQAWKYFNLAGAAWHALNLTQTPNHDSFEHYEGSQSFSLMQSLYFTIWKSESELKLEINVPGPILDNVNFPHAFPLPPDLSSASPEHETAEHERTWLYYLAEIAARHLLNRVLRTYKYFASEGRPTNRSVRKMLAYADILESQIHGWYSSLPSIFQFEMPEGVILPPHTDDLTQVLRHRYLSCKELVCRPFVRLCVEMPLEVDDHLRRRVVDLAAENLRFCMLKVTQVAPHFHQGTWYGLRNFATAALILCSVHLAKQCSWLPGAQELSLPDGWKEQCLVAWDRLSPFWEMKGGGASELGELVKHVLTL